MKEIYIKDDKDFYKNVRKNLNKKEKIHFIYKDDDIVDDSKLKKYKEVEDKIRSIHALNIKDSEKRYSYIYDVICDCLDEEFNKNNICNFIDNKCISVRCNSHCRESLNGCCYGTKRGLCKNYIDGKCSIKSISCKLFTCRYLRKQGIKYPINSFPLLKYFFNIKQKLIIDQSIFKDKDYIIDLLIKNK